jgi:signal transduction histidine kinase
LLLPLLCDMSSKDEASGNWYFAAGILFAWLAGHLLRRQYELVAELRTAQDRMGALAAADERRRIAREIHDIVAHSLTVVVLNVGGARKVMTTDPDAATEALERAEQVGRQALDDIRRTVGLLRDDSSDAAVAPTVAAIPLLVDGYRQAGLDVRSEIDGALDGLDPVTGTTLYRFVQEGLSNVLTHAPGAAVTVSIAVTAREVAASVGNGMPTEPVPPDDGRIGLGLLGMRERIESRHGRFSAGPDGAGWLVECTLPLATHRQTVRS